MSSTFSHPALKLFAFPATLGTATVFSFAPFGAWPVAIGTLAALAWISAHIESKRAAFLAGWSFGLGLFLTGVSWVYVSLHQYGQMPAVLAAIATFLFCAYLALFPALAMWLTVAVTHAGVMRLALAFPAAWCASEWLRGTLFSGFGWLEIGYSQLVASPLVGFAPVLGGFGVTAAVALSAGLVAGLVYAIQSGRGKFVAGAAALGCAALMLVGGLFKAREWAEPFGAPLSVSLAQGNVPQQLKWREDERQRTLDKYGALINKAQGRLVVLPETALPMAWDAVPADYLQAVRGTIKARGQALLVGVFERIAQPDGSTHYYNSVVNMGGEGVYRKRHLVPFGEFIPPGFGPMFQVLNIPLLDFSEGPREQPLIEVQGVKIAANICFEDGLSHIVRAGASESHLMVNVTNDAWFGESWQAKQHVQMAQMRALEFARPMVRATNTGITAAIDHRGNVTARLTSFVTTVLETTVQPTQGATPFARTPVNLTLIACAVVLASLVLARWRKARG